MWPCNPIPEYISGGKHGLKGYMHLNVFCSTVYNSQDMETTEISINRWMDKEDMVHIYNWIQLGHKKEQNNAICSNTDATRDYHTKGSESEKDKYHMLSLKWGL